MVPPFWPRTLRCSAASGRWRGYLLVLALLFCSPVLLPLACLSFPLLCVVGLCLQVGRRRSRQHAGGASAIVAPGEEEAEAWLLQRYLEEQLQLVEGEPAFVSGGD